VIGSLLRLLCESGSCAFDLLRSWCVVICGFERWDVGAEGVCDISLVQDHSCALSTGGAVSCWGYNNYGQVMLVWCCLF
jgi:hypothetical protein